MIEEIYKIIKSMSEHWSHKSSGIALAVGCFFLTAYIFKREFLWWQYCVMLLVGLGAWLIWYYCNKPRKCPKNKVGIILAINPEDLEDEKILSSDFVSKIDELASFHNIYIYKASKKDASSVTNKATAITMCEERNALMIIWGQFKKRMVYGEEVRIMQFNALIRHNPVPSEISNKLGKTMTTFLPVNVQLKKDNEVRTLELLADQTSVASSYFIAVSLCLSGRGQEGAQILDELLANLQNISANFYKRDVICKEITNQLAGTLLSLASDEYSRW